MFLAVQVGKAIHHNRRPLQTWLPHASSQSIAFEKLVVDVPVAGAHPDGINPMNLRPKSPIYSKVYHGDPESLYRAVQVAPDASQQTPAYARLPEPAELCW